MKLLSEYPGLIGRMVESFERRRAIIARRQLLLARLGNLALLSVVIVAGICAVLAGWFVGVRFYFQVNP